ncbi:MAG: hypothetical protein PWQ37_2619 [Candidatus Petromonas sp.]|jgi:ABC-type phosphate transport system ATPase subunit|nr:hypothetical protein [Candidatus Petromonas sp.]
MWTVIYVAHDEKDARKVSEKLTSEGFLVKINESDGMFELLVPGCEAKEAHEVIDECY